MLSTESIKVEFNVPIKMRDGIILYANVYRPDKPGKYPAILTRLPYNKDVLFPGQIGYMNAIRYARAGYAVVIQDVRGTGSSEGHAYYWHQEYEDGYDSVEFVAAEPWCDGNVGMYGLSYFGTDQLRAAVTRPPHLKAICPGGCTSQVSAVFSRRGDKFGLQGHLGWCLNMSGLELLKSNTPPEEKKMLADKLKYLTDHIQEQYRFLPMKDSPAAKLIDELGMKTSYSDLLAHEDDDEYSKQKFGSLFPLDKVVVPALHIGGWYDIPWVEGVTENYLQIKEKGSSELARQNQKLLIGPWIHSTEMSNKVGELDFGMASSGEAIDIVGMHIRWFDYWLKGIDNGITKEPPIRIFIMGDNVWRNENEWPLARTKYTRYYFHSGGRANSRFGDGSLNTGLPDKEPFDSYIYDPRNPIPTNEMGQGAYNQQEVESRADVLVYTSEPLQAELEVTGPVEIKLFAASSAVDTDFTGKLVDVWPDGKAYNIAEGIMRAGYRESIEVIKPLKSGKVYEYSISLGPMSNVFKVGHRIRVEISSSDFPKWDRNLNTGHPLGQDAEIQLAMQTIYHQSKLPSHIVLPVIPRG